VLGVGFKNLGKRLPTKTVATVATRITQWRAVLAGALQKYIDALSRWMRDTSAAAFFAIRGFTALARPPLHRIVSEGNISVQSDCLEARLN
jgi:hypothetical protein